MLFDSILKEIGEFGWYQRRVYLLATLPSALVAFETLSIVFIFFIPDHRCAIPGYPSDTFDIQNANHSLLLNLTIRRTDGKLDQCHVYNVTLDDVIQIDGIEYVTEKNSNVSFPANTSSSTYECQQWVYDFSVFDSTIATDFDVVCERSVHRASSNMISEIGTLLGTLIIGFVADRFGRKIPFCLGGLALVGGGFGIAFSTDLISLNICRFILGFARVASFINGIVIGMEIVGPSKRAWAGILIDMFWCVGEFLLLLLAYFIRNWRHLEIALSVPSIGLLFYWWLIPESPRWLSSMGREKEALQILERIAKSNKVEMPPVDEVSQLMKAAPREEQISWRYAIRSKELLLRIVIVLSNTFVILLVYYGLTLNMTNLSGDLFINFAINTVLEMLSYFLCLLLLDRLGRKPVFTGSMILSGGFCTMSFLPVLLDMPPWVLVALSTAGRVCVSVAFATVFVYGAELYPTVVRSSAMGIGVTFARIGGILSPFIADAGFLIGGRYKDALPMVIMGSPALLVGLLSLWLPETMNTTLPDTLDDLEHSKIQRRCTCCPGSRQEKEVTVSYQEEDQGTTQC